MGPYKRLFEINAHHSFFADNVCRRLEWVPTATTRQTMANLGILARSDAGGMTFYYDTERRQALELFAAQAGPDPEGFFFKVYTRDPYFMNYTDLPESDKEKLFYVDTRQAVAEASGDFRLHRQAHLPDLERVSFSSLWESGLLTRQDRGTPPICVIHVRPVGEDSSPMDAKGNVHAKTYRLSFDQRRTYWKYCVLGPLAGKAVWVQDTNGKWTFDQTEPPALDGNRPALAFISNSPIPLRQIPDVNFQLKHHAADVDKVMINKLPVAPVNMLHREKRGSEDVFISEIFIHS